MGKVVVNGRVYNTPDGASVSVINNKVYVDGKLYEDFSENKEKNIKITIEGDIQAVKVDCGDITVHGNANSVTGVNGDIKINGDVAGNVKTTNGDISAHSIQGDAKTISGDISNRKDRWFNSIVEHIFD